MTQPNENLSLLQAIICDDESALRVIYNKYAKQVYKLSFIILKDTGWSEDVVQDVFIKFWNTRTKLDPQGDIWNFLYVLTKRTALNKLRDVGKTNSGIESIWLNVIGEKSVTVHEVCVANELEFNLGRFLEKLPVRQQEVYRLSRENGYTHQEIASHLGVSQNTVKNHLVAVLKKIRRYI